MLELFTSIRATELWRSSYIRREPNFVFRAEERYAGVERRPDKGGVRSSLRKGTRTPFVYPNTERSRPDQFAR